MTKLNYERIIKALPINYYVIDCKSRKIVESNDPNIKVGEKTCYKHIYGFEKPCKELCAVKCACDELVAKRERLELIQKVKVGEKPVAHKVIASPLFNDNDEVTHIVVQYIDISSEIDLENQLAKQNFELKSQNEEYETINEELREQKEEFEALYEELKVANHELEKSKSEVERLKLFFESISEAVQDGIWVTDKYDLIYYANPTIEKIAGISRVELMNKNILKDFPKETIQEIQTFYNKAKNHLKPIWYEVAVKTLSAKKTYQNGWLIPLVKGGAFNGMICTVRDVTDRVISEKLLKESEEKFRMLFENMEEAFALHRVIVDENNKPINYVFIDVNSQFEKQTGLKRENIINKTVLEVLPGIEKYWIDNYGKVALTGKPIQFENHSEDLDRYYKVTAYCPKPNYFATIFEDITKRKHIEQELIKVNQTLNAAQRIAKLGYWYYNIKTQVPTWSDNLFNLLGVGENKVEPDPLIYKEIVHPEDWKLFDESVNECIIKGKPYNIIVRFIYPDKSEHHINIQGFPRFDDSDNIVELFGIAQDITDSIIAEKALLESEELVNAVGNIAKIGGWEIDLNTTKAKWTKATYDIVEFGYEDEIPGLNEHLNYYLPDFQPIVEEAVKNLIENGVTLDVEAKGRTAKENIKWFKLDGKRVMQDGKCVKIYGTLQDITVRKQAELALKESEEKYRRLTENAKDIIYRMSLPDGNYEYISAASKEIFGYTPEEFYNNPKLIQKVIHPDWHNYFNVQWENLVKGDLPPTYEYQIISKSGEEKWINQRNLLIKNKKGTPIAIEGIVTDTTEQKTAELALRDNEKKLRNITENSTNLFYQHTVDHILTYLSPQVKDILGHNVDEALVKWTELATDNPINEEGVKKTEKAIKTGEVQPPYELELRHKSGRKVRVEVREAPLIEKGQVTGIVGALTDITERKITEDALKESEERYRKLFESANVGIGISTQKGNIVAVNDSMTKIFGYSHDELLKINIKELYADKNDRKHLLEKLKKKEEIKNFNLRMKPKSNKELWVSVSIQFFDMGGEKRLLSVLSDITKEKQAEIELRKQEEKFRTYIESSPVAVFIANEKGEFEYVNDASCQLLRYSRNELLNFSIPDLQPKENVNREIESFKTLQKEGVLKGHKTQLKRKDGRVVDVDLSAVKLSEKQFIAFVNDITKVIEYERNLKEKNEEYYALNEELEENIERIQKINYELKVAKERAEESDRLKSAFLANMSHEIRTPLNGILGFSALLQKKELTNEAYLRYASIIESSGKRLLSVVSDIFDISLIHADQMKIEKEDFEINELLEEIETLYKTIQKDKIENIVFDLKKGITSELTLYNDKFRLHQVFKNLLDNAFKFTQKGFIEFGYLPVKSNEIVFYVKDTGIGIPEAYKETIFSAFRQVDESITRDFEGAGLGLSICKGLVERMGGEIWHESAQGKGSTFYFKLPLNNIEEDAKTQKKDIAYNQDLLKDKSVLVVEDDQVSYEFLRIFLENHGGNEIIHTAYGKHAIKIVKQNKIDLIFMDVRLPDIDGYETTQLIRAFNQRVKIIAQTAYALQNDREKALEAGCNEYITKPINEDILISLLEKCLK